MRKLTRKQLLIPAAFVATAATGCSGPPNRQCTTTDPCFPDGGHVCFSETCGVAREADGGYVYDTNGQPQCLC